MKRKIVSIAIGIALIGAGIVAVSISMQNSGKQKEETNVMETELEEEVQTEMPATEISTAEFGEEQTEEFQPVEDEMYTSLLKGNLTKDQLSYVLAFAPEAMSEKGLSGSEMYLLADRFAIRAMDEQDGLTEGDSLGIRYYGSNPDTYEYIISTEDTNRILQVITDYQFTDGNDVERINVQGDNLSIMPSDGSVWSEILSAQYNADEMDVIYEHTNDNDPTNTVVEKRLAILKRQDDGLYQIKQIWPIQDESDVEKIKSGEWNWKLAYWDVIKGMPDQKHSDEIESDIVVENPMINYYLTDLAGDAIPELIVVVSSYDDPRSSWMSIYSYDQATGIHFEGETSISSEALWKDENSKHLIYDYMSGGTGETTAYYFEFGDGSIHGTEMFTRQFMSWEELEAYNEAQGYTELERGTMNDFSLLNEWNNHN